MHLLTTRAAFDENIRGSSSFAQVANAQRRRPGRATAPGLGVAKLDPRKLINVPVRARDNEASRDHRWRLACCPRAVSVNEAGSVGLAYRDFQPEYVSTSSSDGRG
jgi:hypothetical protein